MEAEEVMGRKSYGINMLPAGTADEQRERGQLHTAYETETAFYSCIRAGDVQGVEKMMGECLKAGVFVGRMSTDALTQTKYFAVCCVAVACRYAIAGGMDETDAYLYSDDCIMRVDKMTDPEEIVGFLTERATDFAARVAESGTAAHYPPAVRRAVNYVNRRLHERITLGETAAYCGLSEGYLSALFRKSVGCSLSRYVVRRKLEAGKAMLLGGYSVGEVAYGLGFSSESHFISRFGEEFGCTPAVWAARERKRGVLPESV